MSSSCLGESTDSFLDARPDRPFFPLSSFLIRNMPSTYNDIQQQIQQAPMPYPPQPYGPYPPESYQSPYSQGQDPSRDMGLQQQQPQSQPHSPPSPSRKSIFDFVSPFDALANTNTGSLKKKPVPEPGPEADDGWLASVNDPKRKSMENLMDQLTRSQAPPHAPSQQQLDSYSPDPNMAANMPPTEPMRGQTYMKQTMPGSPRGSPPRAYGPQTHQTQPRSRESPLGAMQQVYGGKGRSEASPVRGGWKGQQESKMRVPKPKAFVNTP